MKYIVITKQNIINNLITFLVIFILIFFNKNIFQSNQNATEVFLHNILPSLLPFVLLTSYLILSNQIYNLTFGLKHVVTKLFNISKVTTPCLILGYLFGYPNGARYLTTLYTAKQISTKEYLRLVCLTSNANPVYIFTYIGVGLLNNSQHATILFISHLLSSILLLIFTRNTTTQHVNIIPQTATKANNTDIIFKSIRQSLTLLATIFVFTMIFSAIPPVILPFLKTNKLSETIIYCFFEISTGLVSISKLALSSELKLILISCTLSFGSLMILLQIISVCTLKRKMLVCLFISKMVQCLLSGIITYILLTLFNTPWNFFEIFQIYKIATS